MNTLFNSNICPDGECLDKCKFDNGHDEETLNNLIEYLKKNGPEIQTIINEIKSIEGNLGIAALSTHLDKINKLKKLAIEIPESINYYYIDGKVNKDGKKYDKIDTLVLSKNEFEKKQMETYVKEKKLYLVGYDQNMFGLAKKFILLNIEGPYLKNYQPNFGNDGLDFMYDYIKKDQYGVRLSNDMYLDRILYDGNFKGFLNKINDKVKQIQTSGGKKFMKKYSRYAKKRYNKSNKNKKSNKKGKSRKMRKH